MSLEKLESRALLAAVSVVPDQLQLSFESTDEFEQLGGTHSGVAIVTTPSGNGGEFLDGDQLVLETQGRLDSRRGTLSFDFKPNWDWADDQHHTLIDAGNFQVFKWHKVTPNQNVFILKYRDAAGTAHQATLRTSGSDNDLFGDGSAWKDSWHHITVEWDLLAENKVIYFDIDGKLGPNDSSNSGPNRRVISNDGIANLSANLKIGHGQYGDAQGVLDNLIIGDVQPIFHAPMHDPASVSTHGGSTTGSPTHTGGQVGDGISITAGKTLSYSNIAGLDQDRGTFSLDFKPNWDFSDPTGPTGGRHTLLDVGAIKVFKWHKPSALQDVFMVSITHTDGSTTEASVRTSNGDNDLLLDGSPWKDAWHHIDVFWDATAASPLLSFMIDGKRGATTGFKQPGVATFSPELKIGHGSWNTGDGTFDEFRVYDNSVWDANDPIGSYTEITAGNGIWDHHETIHNSVDAQKLSDSIAAGQNQVFYETPTLGRVYEGTTPDASQIKSTIDYDIAQGEYETLFFNLYSRAQLDDATLEVSSVTGPGGATLAGGKLHVVKNWWQGGTGPHRKLFPEYVPELLLSSDIDGHAADLETGSWAPKTLPSLPVAGNSVHTSLQSHTSKQFAYVLEVPEGTAAGEYTATVELKEGGSFLETLTLRIQVESFALLDAGKEYITYHQSIRSDPNSNRYVTNAVFQAELEDLSAHGLTGVINYEYDVNTLNTMMQQSTAAGLEKVIAIRHTDANQAAIVANFNSNGLEPWFYGKDEPNSAEKIDDHINLSDDVHDHGGLVFSAIRDEYANRLINDPFDANDSSSVYYDPNTASINLDDPDVSQIQPLDVANISASDGAAQVYFDSLVNDPSSDVPDRTFYWQSLQENPSINRSMTGFYLWNTGMGGVAPYVYQDIRNNPYDDWDVWSSTTPSYRDHLTTYPSQQGPVTTMQWEAFREGIDDVRYLQTWTSFYTQLNSLDPAAAAVSKSAIDAVLDHYKDHTYNGTTTIAGASAEQFASDRGVIRGEIHSLMDQLDVLLGGSGTHTQNATDDFLVFQAEDGLSVDLDNDGQNWVVESDSGHAAGTAAAVGQVLRANGNGYPSGNEADVFYNVEFNNPNFTQYNLYVRTRNDGTTGGADSLFNVENASGIGQLNSLEFAADAVHLNTGFDSTYRWKHVGVYDVTPGTTETLRIGIREINTRLDAFVFHADAGLDQNNPALLDGLTGTGSHATHSQPNSNSDFLAFQAEDGAVVDLNGNGGKWVAETDTGHTGGDAAVGQALRAASVGFYNDGGESDVVYNLSFSNTAHSQYHLYARVRNETSGNQDSFNKAQVGGVDVLNAADFAETTVSLGSGAGINGIYHWRKVGTYDVDTGTTQSLRIGIREKNTRVDSFVFHVTNNLQTSNPDLLDSLSGVSLRSAGSEIIGSDAETLRDRQLAIAVREARRRWRRAGADVSGLRDVTVSVGDLPGNLLGLASGKSVVIDSNAAGYGWYVDRNLQTDSEFLQDDRPAGIDLLTVVMHEFGHVLGYGHDDPNDGIATLMDDTLGEGERRSPGRTDASIQHVWNESDEQRRRRMREKLDSDRHITDRFSSDIDRALLALLRE